MSTPPPPAPYGGGPYGAPQAPRPPAKKNRTALFVAIGCAVLFVGSLVLGGGGVGIYLLTREPAEGPTTSEAPPEEDPTEPLEDPVEDPDQQADQQTDEPTDEPTDEASDDSSASVTLRVTGSEEVSELETNNGPLDPVNGSFFGAEVELTNKNDEAIGLDLDNFMFYDADGEPYDVTFGRFSTAGPEIPSGETATAQVYADVPPEADITIVAYQDPVATSGMEVELPIG